MREVDGSESWESEAEEGIGGTEGDIAVTGKGVGTGRERERGSWNLRFSENDLGRGLQT